MDRIQEDLAFHDVPTLENALEQLEHMTFPKGSQYALSISRRIFDLLERQVITFTGKVRWALNATFQGLENPEIIECMDRVLAWRTDRHWVLMDLIENFEPTDSTAKYIMSRLQLMRPLQHPVTIPGNIDLISEKFRNHFTPSQIDEFLAYILTPEALNAQGPDGLYDDEFICFDEDETPAYRVFCAVNHLMPHLSSANWKTIGNCFFQLNYTPVEIVTMLYDNDKHPPQGVDVDALILACYEVASEFRFTKYESYEALEVLMSTRTEMDDRLLGRIAALIVGNLWADLPDDVDVDSDYYSLVRDSSAALVNEVVRLQTGSLWNVPLVYALFETFRVGQGNSEDVISALLKFPAWPGDLLRQHISVIVRALFKYFRYNKGMQEFWTRLCREYPAPEMELLDALSELVETGVVFSERNDMVRPYGSWQALETILSSRAYQAANPGPDSLFWQRLRAKIEPFLDSDDPQKKSRAYAVLAQYSSCVNVDALILACYEVARDFRHINDAGYEALEVLMRRQTEMDDRLLGKIATLIIGNLEAEPALGRDIDDYLRVRGVSAALVNEVLRLQKGDLWNTPLLRGLFEPFRVGREIGFERNIAVFRALLEFPDWPSELLREFISEIIRSVFVSFSNFPEQKQDATTFWERFCREYPAPEMELMDSFSEVAVAERAGLDDSWEALETILSSRAYRAASPGPDSLFWQRLRAKIEPFLDSDDPQKKSRACAVLAQYSG